MRRRLLALTLVLGISIITIQPHTTPALPRITPPVVQEAGDPDDLGQRPASSPDGWIFHLAGWVLTWLVGGEVL
jgi:hypothetical protein